MTPPTQSFAKHAQWTPIYHFFTSPLALIFLIWSIRRAISNPNNDSYFMVVGALAVMGLSAVARVSPIRVQDRLIRLEERMRLARLLPADMQSRIEELSTKHLIALRFASDGEVTELVKKVLANPAMSQKEIKQQIRNWRPDHFRV